MSAETTGLPDGLLGSVIDYAHGRIEYARSAAGNRDRTGVLHALHQLKGICAHVGDDGLTRRIHRLETDATACASADGLAAMLERELPAVEARLEGLDPGGQATRTRPLADAMDPVIAQARAVARRRGIDLSFEEPSGRDIELPARLVLMLMDLLGHLVRNAVVHGSAAGSVRVMLDASLDAGELICRVTNSGALRSGPPAVDIDAGRGIALDAVAAELDRIGGSLEHGPTDGGYRAAIRVPVPSPDSRRVDDRGREAPLSD